MSDDALVESLRAHYGTPARRAAQGDAVADDWQTTRHPGCLGGGPVGAFGVD